MTMSFETQDLNVVRLWILMGLEIEYKIHKEFSWKNPSLAYIKILEENPKRLTRTFRLVPPTRSEP